MAKKKRPNSPNIVNAKPENVIYYVNSDTGEPLKAYGSAIGEYSGSVRANRMNFDPSNVGGSRVSGRYNMTHGDYEEWRPHEKSSFRNAKDAMLYADSAYHAVISDLFAYPDAFGLAVVPSEPGFALHFFLMQKLQLQKMLQMPKLKLIFS